MHRAGLAEEAAAKKLEDAIDLDERAPEAMCRAGVIARMGAILRKANGIGHLVRQLVDGDARHRYRSDTSMTCRWKTATGLRFERDRALFASAGAQDKLVTDEVEFDLQDFGPMGIGDVPSPRAVT